MSLLLLLLLLLFLFSFKEMYLTPCPPHRLLNDTEQSVQEQALALLCNLAYGTRDVSSRDIDMLLRFCQCDALFEQLQQKLDAVHLDRPNPKLLAQVCTCDVMHEFFSPVSLYFLY